MEDSRIMRVCTEAARLLLQYGAETSRVEETIQRIATGAGLTAQAVQSFVTPTGIFISITHGDQTMTRLVRASGSAAMDLSKVTAINDVSRRISSGRMSVESGLVALSHIERQKPLYGRVLQDVCAALSSGSFCMVIGGNGLDFLSAALSGLLAQLVASGLRRYAPRSLAVLAAATCAALFALSLSDVLRFAGTTHAGAAIIGGVLPLLPGLAVTTSIRDLLSGDLLSGVARGADALFTAAAIAVAVAIAIGVAPKV